jgi:hypothetical protein
MVERRHSLESPFHGVSNKNPLVVVESFRRFVRGLECVGLGDLIVDVVIDAAAVSVASNASLFRRFFVVGECKVSLVWSDWREWDPVADIALELGQRVVVNFVGGLENGMGATHFGRFVLVGGRASIVEGSVAA